jgi:hypothetical protein
MGNVTNENNWAARERLRRVELLLWWRGWAGRVDLMEGFGISAAQASGDFQRYVDLNPGAMAYQMRRKRYEGTPAMRCVLHEPRLEEAVWLFYGGEMPVWGQRPVIAATGERRPVIAATVDVFRPLVRRAAPQVERRVILAMEQGRRLKVCYASMNSSRAEWREIAPHALGHDGYRWHVRAWCFRNEDFRDFAPSRMEAAEWPGEAFELPVADEEWERLETLVLVPHAGLTAEQRRAIELDYGMENGRLKVEVRAAMREYFLAHCRIPAVDENGSPRPQHLDVLERGR